MFSKEAADDQENASTFAGVSWCRVVPLKIVAGNRERRLACPVCKPSPEDVFMTISGGLMR
jgi:hypothetical protein